MRALIERRQARPTGPLHSNRIVSLLCLVALLVSPLALTGVPTGIQPAVAASSTLPALSLSRPSGAPGVAMTVRGYHFTAATPVTISLAADALASVTTTASGAFVAPVVVPELPPGRYTLSAATITQTAGILFVVTPRPAARLSLAPRVALPGSPLTIAGARFAASEPVTVTIAGTPMATQATPQGTFVISTTVPQLAPGVYPVSALGALSRLSVSVPLRVVARPTPSLSLSRTASVPGRLIGLRGFYFGANETVQVTLASALVATATTTAGGSFATSFTVPPLAPMQTALKALGTTSGISVTRAFQVLAPPPPAFGLSRRSAYSGQTIVAQGAHFGPGEVVNIALGPLSSVATATTTMGGAFRVTFAVPVLPPGIYSVTATGLGSAISAGFPLAIVTPPVPALVLARHTGVAGTIVPARGYHFGPGETVTISMGVSTLGTATTNARGWFYARLIVPALPSGTYQVSAHGARSGINAATFFVVNPAPYGALSGLVTDGVSTVAGAVVHAEQPASGRSATTTTDAGGAYHLTLRTGFWRLSALVRDGVHLRLPPVTVFVGAAAVVNENLLAPRAPALIEGSVYGPPSSTITVTAYSGTRASQVAVGTDTTGRASYTLGATIGLWHVGAVLPLNSRDSYDPPHSRAVAVTRVGSAAAPIVYGSGTTLTFIPAPYTIVVTVKDSTGAPVTSGIRVSAWSPDFPNGGIGTGTSVNVNGVYTLHVAGATWRVDVDRPDAPSPLDQRVIANAANPSVPLTFVLQAAPDTIGGVVYNAEGQPVAGAVVLARAADGELVRGRGLNSGAYLLHVFPGAWSVMAFAPELGLVGRAALYVPAGANLVQDFAAPVTYRVGGTVRVGGAPLAFATLHAYAVNGRNHAETALDGTYSMLLPIGSYTLRGYAVQAGSLGDDFFTVTRDIFNQDWNLPAQGLAHVVVQVGGVTINDPTGTAARVSAWDPYTGYWNATSDNAGGAYNLPLLAGIYSVRVSVPGQGQLEQRNVQISPNGTVTLFFNFAAYGTVQGTLSDTSGMPIMGAAVFMTHQRIHVRTITDARGYYALHVQPGQTYYLDAQQPGYVLTNAQHVTVSAATTQTINLKMVAAANPVSGSAVVAGTGGAPAVYAWVWAFDYHGGYAQTRSNGFGNWGLRLSPGRWYLRARFDGYYTAAAVAVDVPATGSVSGLRLVLTPIPAYSAPLPAATTFQPAGGVSVSTPDNSAEVQVPPNAAGNSTASYSIDVQETTTVPDTANGTPLGGRGVNVTISDADNNPLSALGSSMMLNLSYDPSLLPAGVSGSALTVGYLDAATGTWQPLAGTVDVASHTISVAATQLGTFAILLPQ